ncbi:hypothetical protein DPMN_077104 [Dreissena polymorpha]|uniref:Uncharacterized protein n=1 Tax=Dreissena polymorpha TaxID=45954 RepID=A0A9D3YKB1_DREPO|nr:hypothetical protein DPMN_077104 [Dreissena polymorpha]
MVLRQVMALWREYDCWVTVTRCFTTNDSSMTRIRLFDDNDTVFCDENTIVPRI